MERKCLEKNYWTMNKIFQRFLGTGLLKSETASSLSRLMSEIERNLPSDFD